MRLITPSSLRELSLMIRAKSPKLLAFAEVVDQCANELESRDAEIEGLKRALETKKASS